ncbi:MAG: carbohydrate kinase family protein [Patescibacteria group bacterium]
MVHSNLIICGSIALDRIMNFSGRYSELINPEKLHVLSVSILLDKIEETRGGSGANIAYYAAQLGDKPILFDSAGKDAANYIKELAAGGVNTKFVHESSLPTASFNVMTDMDDNQIGGFYPGAMSDASSLSLRSLPGITPSSDQPFASKITSGSVQRTKGTPLSPEAILAPKSSGRTDGVIPGRLLKQWDGQDVVVCISAHDPKSMRAQTEECKSLGLRLIYDPGQQVSNVAGEDLQAGVDAAEVLIVNDYELGAIVKKTGLTPDAIKAKVPIVITTFGKHGSVIEGASLPAPLSILATKPAKVVDPTGAGDAFRAGFLYGYLRQWGLLACGQLGSTIASFVVEQHGTQHTLDLKAVQARHYETFNQEIQL